MILILEIAVGVALAPVLFALGVMLLGALRQAVLEVPYFVEDHPNVCISLCCGALAVVLVGLR